MAPRVIISVTNDLGMDQRVHRVALALTDMGYEVCLVGRLRPRSLPLPPRRYATKRIRFFFESGKFFYLAYAVRMFWWLLFQRVDVLLSNDMDTLLPNFLVAKLRGKKIVYDSHEYWTEVPELEGRRFTRGIWLWLERRLFPRVDAAYTVNDSIAKIYSELYHRPVSVVRNLPFRLDVPAQIGAKERVIIYQGALNVGRDIELMIEAMRFLPEYRLLIAGFGDLEEPLRRLAAARPYHAQVTFTGYLPLEAMKTYTQSAMLGLSLEADRGKSYHYALPNKLFDYIQSGIPVLVSDLPEMAAIVNTYKVGGVLAAAERHPENLAARIREICENVDKYSDLALNCQNAAKELCWENEKMRLENIFKPYLG